MQKLNISDKDKRTLRIGGMAAAAVLMLALGVRWFEHWRLVRSSLAASRAEIKTLNSSGGASKPILPAFEMPEKEETQQFLFRDKLAEQFKKANIKTEPLQVLAATKTRQGGYRVMRLKCRGNCRLEQMFDFMATLEENPYLVSVEECKLKCDEKDRANIQFDLTVSTFVR